MKLRNDLFGLLLTGALALSGCPGEKPAATDSKDSKATPAAPASQPAATSTKAHGALDKGSSPDDRGQVDADGVMRRGRALSAAKAISVTEAYAGADKLAGQTVKVAGKVDKVCEAMGCWFVVTGAKPEERVKITAKDHGFFVPVSAIGRVATVEGQLSIGKAAEGDDCAEQKDPKVQVTRELTVEATGVEMLASNG